LLPIHDAAAPPFQTLLQKQTTTKGWMDEVFIILPQGKQEQNATAKKEKRKDQRSGRRKKIAHSLTPQMLQQSKLCEWWWVQDLLCKCVCPV
jgi:hypothetical protein